ncbi:hypothetical protein BGZ47_009324 [Haplosporangium gracile]|nr:hypothetical protein BGZ47_009324 [Haplosporangium gracile]
MHKRFLDLPELLAQVGSYLHPTDLFACILVSRAFHHTFIPHLWNTIDDSTEPWVSILRVRRRCTRSYLASLLPKDPAKDRDWLFATFKKHGHHIRHLRIQFLVVLQAVSEGGSCKGLKSLVVKLGRYAEEAPNHVHQPQPILLFPPPLAGQGGAGGQVGEVGGFGIPAPAVLLPMPAGGDVQAEAEGGTGAEVATPGGFGNAVPIAAPGGFGVAALAAAGGLFGAAPALVPAPGGLFGATPAPPAPPAAGFGGFSFNAPAPPDPIIELSEPMFPNFLTEADIIPKQLISSKTVQSIKAVAEYEWILTQHLWHLVRTNPGLEQFDTFKRYSVGFVPVSADFAYATLRSLRHLKVLDGRCRFEKVEFWKLWSCLPAGIESLSVDCSVFPLPDPLPEVNNLSLRVLKARGTMAFLDSKESTTLNGLLTLLGIFSNLVYLKVGQVQLNPSSSLDPSFIPMPLASLGGQFLKRLDAIVDDWDTILRYIPSIADWVNGTELLEGDVSLLAKRFPRLESFKVIHRAWDVDELVYPRAENDPTNQFLATNSHLRKFDSIKNYIRVDEMLRLPWTCMGLEWLTCRIVGVDRLKEKEEAAVAKVMVPDYSTELTEEETRAVEKFHRCRAQHYGVYDRLASLTRLKHLDLGFENRNAWEYKGGNHYIGEDGERYLEYSEPTFDTLELTLESGLGRLVALKDLEMFGFECINHKIGKAELDWMAKSWPKLMLMYGLNKERLMYIEYDKKRIELRKYFKRLRPEVVHDSLFEDDI